jgi:hypothetical protein
MIQINGLMWEQHEHGTKKGRTDKASDTFTPTTKADARRSMNSRRK